MINKKKGGGYKCNLKEKKSYVFTTLIIKGEEMLYNMNTWGVTLI